jgi:predicted small secreted protein
MRFLQIASLTVLLLSLAFVLAACGGGGGGY